MRENRLSSTIFHCRDVVICANVQSGNVETHAQIRDVNAHTLRNATGSSVQQNVKLNVTPEDAMKAQRGSRGTALLVL
jgi:hypothetical protein